MPNVPSVRVDWESPRSVPSISPGELASVIHHQLCATITSHTNAWKTISAAPPGRKLSPDHDSDYLVRAKHGVEWPDCVAAHRRPIANVISEIGTRFSSARLREAPMGDSLGVYGMWRFRRPTGLLVLVAFGGPLAPRSLQAIRRQCSQTSQRPPLRCSLEAGLVWLAFGRTGLGLAGSFPCERSRHGVIEYGADHYTGDGRGNPPKSRLE